MSESGKYWDAAINPIVHLNCTCEVRDCWAKGMIKRFNIPSNKNVDCNFLRNKLTRNRNPRVYAFNWLADFAHTSVEHHQIYWTMITLENANAARIKIGKMPHTYLLLTKWIGRFWEMESELAGGYCHDDNFYIGTSVSDQATADERIPHLMKFAENGWKTWLSIEPMLGPVVLKDEWLAALNQVVVGGETGRDARKLEIRWVEDIQRQCHLSGVPFFLKSLGSAHKNSRELADGEHNELAWKIAK